MDEKVIGSLPVRRKAVEAVRALAQTRSEAEIVAGARAIIDEYPPDVVLAALVGELDTASSQLRGALARLAPLLPHDEVTGALQTIVADRGRSQQARVTARLILEQYLGESVSPALAADLESSSDAAMASLLEAIDEGRENRAVLLDYVEQMREHPPAIAFAVLDALDKVPKEDRAGLLRLMALDDRPAIARAALSRLEAIALEGERSATAALHTLRFMLPRELALTADRTLRKLQMRGQPWTPVSTAGWRALISSPHMDGTIALWFIGPESTDAEGQPVSALFAGVAVCMYDGVVDCHAIEEISLDDPQVGKSRIDDLLIGVARKSSEYPTPEVGFDTARWLLHRAVQQHWKLEDPEPLPRDFVLNGDLLWQFAAPAPHPEFEQILFGELPAEPPTARDAEAAVRRLLKHEGTRVWQIPGADPMGTQLLREFRKQKVTAQEAARQVLETMDDEEVGDDLIREWSDALRALALWLGLQGESALQQDALSLARLTERVKPSENPLAVALVHKGVGTASHF